MDLEKILLKLKEASGYAENATHYWGILARSEERNSAALRKMADEVMKTRRAAASPPSGKVSP